MKYPLQSGIWRSVPGLEFFGDLLRTVGINLLVPGFLTLARKPILLYSNADDTNFNRIVAIIPDTSTSKYAVVTIGSVYTLNNDGQTVTALTSGAPDTYGGSDAVYFNSKLVVSGQSSSDAVVKDYASGSWSSAHVTFTGGASYPTLLEVFENKNAIAVANANVVKICDTSWTVLFTLTIPAEFVITTMRWMGGSLYIGTLHQSGGSAKMFRWNGATTYAQDGYPVGSDWIYSMERFDGSIVIVTAAGLLSRFNGGGFDPLAAFPVYNTALSWKSSASIATSSAGNVAHRGMCTRGDTLFINVRGDLNQNIYDYPGPFLPAQPSGVWTYTTANGLAHLMGFGNKKYRTLTVSRVASSTLVLSAAHDLATGDPVYANSTGNITGITTGHLYFAVVDTTTNLKLAASQSDALAGRTITLTGTANADTVCVDDTSSMGAVYEANNGAICPLTIPFSNSFFGSEILFSGEPVDTSGTTIHALYSAGRQAATGSFVLGPIPAVGIKDVFHKLVLALRQLRFSCDSIELKYRKMPRLGVPTPVRVSSSGYATWVTDSSFTIDTTAKDFRSSQEGDEIHIISGSSAGYTAHIDTIDDTSSTYIVTLDRSIPGITVGDKSEVIAEDWTKLPSSFSASTADVAEGFAVAPVDKTASVIEFKLVLSGYELVIRSVDIPTAERRA